jgi:hypothetical protein
MSEPETFPDLTFNFITDDASGFAFDRHAQARVIEAVSNPKYNTGVEALHLALMEKSKIFKSSSNSDCFGELQNSEGAYLAATVGVRRLRPRARRRFRTFWPFLVAMRARNP